MTTTTPKPKPETVVHPTLAAALAAFQRDLPTVRKDNTAKVDTRTGGNYSYAYADLTDVSSVVLPALATVGLAWHTGLDTVDGNVVIRWELLHADSGESRTGTLPVGRAGTDWQSMGSAITYARRYALTAATGVAPGGDDDDAKSASTAGSRPAPTPAQQKPVERPTVAPRLPADLYNLGAIDTKAKALEVWHTAGRAGHLPLVIAIDGQDIPFGQWLQARGIELAAAEQAATADPEAAAIAEHEATLAIAGDDDIPF